MVSVEATMQISPCPSRSAVILSSLCTLKSFSIAQLVAKYTYRKVYQHDDSTKANLPFYQSAQFPHGLALTEGSCDVWSTALLCTSACLPISITIKSLFFISSSHRYNGTFIKSLYLLHDI